MKHYLDKLKDLFSDWSGTPPTTVMALPRSGSDRVYFRLASGTTSAIGAFNPVDTENKAFFHFTQVFRKNGLHVPEIFSATDNNRVYLLEDLGDISLYSLVEKTEPGREFPAHVKRLYEQALEELVTFQVVAGKQIDYSLCYPRSSFDTRSITWDLNYFKYYFLKLYTEFHEDRLENDFQSLAEYLAAADHDYFMYRDFQSRNIMIREGQPYFIDYQGGRKGPLPYDVASLLFQVKADLPFGLRDELLEYYLESLSQRVAVDPDQFRKQYHAFVLARLLQVLGAYGYRGIIENKPHFLQSIPYAIKNLQWWLENIQLEIELPELTASLHRLVSLPAWDRQAVESGDKSLTVLIGSFSYKKGLPADYSGHGGGFIFDCRSLPNPGREEQYRDYDGRDAIIRDYLGTSPEVSEFLAEAERLVAGAVKNYLNRGFSHLMAGFGCTGGQHRSVYCAETLAERLRRAFPEARVIVEHRELISTNP